MKRLALVTCVYDLVKRGSTQHRTVGGMLEKAAFVLGQERELVIFTEPELKDELLRRRGDRHTQIVTVPFEELLGHDRVAAAERGTFQTNALLPRKNQPYVQLTWSKFSMLERALEMTTASHVGWIDVGITHIAKLPPEDVDIFADPSDAPRIHVLRCFSKHDVDQPDYWRVVWGHAAAGVIVGDRDQMRRLVGDFWKAVDCATSMGLVPFEEGLLSYVVGQRPRDFTYSYGDYEDILRNHDAPRGGEAHRAWIVADARSRGLPDTMDGPSRPSAYMHDPAVGSIAVVGFPAVILDRPAEHCSHVAGRYERALVDWSLQLAPAGKQFVDCGAYTGSWALIMAAHFREVHAFEPQRLIFQQLCGNVALNRLANVFAHNLGLDEAAGRLVLQHSGAGEKATARSDVAARFGTDSSTLRPETVAACPLDSFSDVLSDVGLVKIDVAGLELRVLRGAVEVLRRNDLPKLIVECWAAEWYRHDKERLLRFLEEVGYRVMPIMGYGDVLLAEKR